MSQEAGWQDEEAALVERARTGDRAAFARLVERYQRPLARYLLYLVGDRAVALRLVQDAFVRAYRAVQATRPGLPVRVWLYRIATNLAYGALRPRRRFARPAVRAVEPQAEGATPRITEERELVRQAVASLTPAERAVLLLCGMERRPYQEVASILGTSPEAVRRRFARAKNRFRQALVELSGGTG